MRAFTLDMVEKVGLLLIGVRTPTVKFADNER